VIDTRNAFEVAMGTFEGAIDPGIKSFGQFKEFAAQKLDPASTRRSRCSAPAVSGARRPAPICWPVDSDEVYHLKGGILRYLEGVPETRAAGAANVSYSTNGWRWDTGCGTHDN
jgi:UPF0176 protein